MKILSAIHFFVARVSSKIEDVDIAIEGIVEFS